MQTLIMELLNLSIAPLKVVNVIIEKKNPEKGRPIRMILILSFNIMSALTPAFFFILPLG